MKTLKLAGFLMFFLGLGILNSSYAQTTVWKFDAADNSGKMIQMTVTSSETKIEMATKGDAAWTGMKVLYTDEYGDYYRVQSVVTSKIYELTFYWAEDKVVRTSPDGTTLTYWLRKS